MCRNVPVVWHRFLYATACNRVSLCVCSLVCIMPVLGPMWHVFGRCDNTQHSRVCLKVSEGLHYLWTEHRAIHRDIKPGNILVNTHGEIKLCDFGTSRILDAPGQNGVTFIGTMNYMSPERLEGNRHAITGDVFSLGLMLMELASG